MHTTFSVNFLQTGVVPGVTQMYEVDGLLWMYLNYHWCCVPTTM